MLSGDKTYVGFIENVSENGFEYLSDTPIKSPEDFHPEKIVEVYFQMPSGEALNMSCAVKWLSKSRHDGISLNMGVKITDPSPKFKGLIEMLDIVSVN